MSKNAAAAEAAAEKKCCTKIANNHLSLAIAATASPQIQYKYNKINIA